MGCCGKIKNIAKGYTRLATDTIRVTEKYEFTDSRVRICQKCDERYWIGRTLWCSLCKCFVPAKARVKDEHCKLGKWENGKELA